MYKMQIKIAIWNCLDAPPTHTSFSIRQTEFPICLSDTCADQASYRTADAKFGTTSHGGLLPLFWGVGLMDGVLVVSALMGYPGSNGNAHSGDVLVPE